MTKEEKFHGAYSDEGQYFEVYEATEWHENGKRRSSFLIAKCNEEGDYLQIVNALNDKHDQKERIKSLESAGSDLLQAMNQYSFFLNGYGNGSASLAEVNHANDEVFKAQNVLFELLTPTHK